MDFFTLLQTIFLGVVQGLTEFIPISSSGHLYILPQILGWEAPSTILILFAHLGTLLALLVYFRQEIKQYLRVLFSWIKPQTTNDTNTSKELINVILATIPAGIIGYLLQNYITGFYDQEANKLAIIITLIAFSGLGLVFILFDKIFKEGNKSIDKLPRFRSLLVGTAQALAFIRGTSRSGITLVAGQLANLSRVEAARFSFLMSIPLLTATSLLGITDLFRLPENEFLSLLPAAVIILLVSFVSGLVAIRFLLQYLQNNGLSIFGWYRIIFAIIVAFILL